MAIDVQRALKDPAYRKTLTPEELALLPENPALTPELTEEDLGAIAGGAITVKQKVVD
jgi:mersacidin/lichenicidin family type 2 lantibiotic